MHLSRPILPAFLAFGFVLGGLWINARDHARAMEKCQQRLSYGECVHIVR